VQPQHVQRLQLLTARNVRDVAVTESFERDIELGQLCHLGEVSNGVVSTLFVDFEQTIFDIELRTVS
jgi:hypothetical protein